MRRQILLFNDLLPSTHTVDVTAKNYKYKYVIEQSFTYFDLQFYIQFIRGQERNLENTLKGLSVDQTKKFVHNIFPDKGQSILHLVGNNFLAVDHLTQLSKKEQFAVPFMLNSEQVSALDLAVEQNDHKLANSIVKLLQRAPLDHHARFTAHLVPRLIEMNLPALEKYFDKRRFQPGLCSQVRSGRLVIPKNKDFIARPSPLMIDNEQTLHQEMMHPLAKEQSLQLEVLDLPLKHSKLQEEEDSYNQYELKLVESFANSNPAFCGQKSVRALIDFMWPVAKERIFKCLFLPYMAFILYYALYLVVLKKLTLKEQEDPAFYKFTSDLFGVFDFLFKLVLFLGCIYFLQQDLLQIKSTSNSIVIWSYANIVPLLVIVFITTYDTIAGGSDTEMRRTFFSLSAFLVWIRVIHLLKCFSHSAHLLRLGSAILYAMRFLIFFILIAVLSFGFTFYFLSEDPEFTPLNGF